MTSETKELIKDIKKHFKVNDMSELSTSAWSMISGDNRLWENRLTEEFMDMYADKLNWDIVSLKQILPQTLVDKYTDRLNWEYISRYRKISEDFIEANAHRLDWDVMSIYQNLPEHLIIKYKDKVDWYYIGEFQTLSPEFILNNFDRLNSIHLVKNVFLKDIRKNIDRHPGYVDVWIKLYIENGMFSPDDLKKKVKTQRFWKNYVNYLKEKYPDKNIFQIKLLDKVNELSELLNLKKEKVLEILNKVINRHFSQDGISRS